LITLADFLTAAPAGEVRLTGHRTGLYHVMHYYNQGFTPDMLVCQYPTLPLALIHKVIAWYLENQVEADRYLDTGAHELSRQRDANPRCLDVVLLRQRLEQQRHAARSEPAESA
jgi:uncharacterized protein (DUF433 family)